MSLFAEQEREARLDKLGDVLRKLDEITSVCITANP